MEGRGTGVPSPMYSLRTYNNNDNNRHFVLALFYWATSWNLCDSERDGRGEGSRLSRATTSVNSSQNLSHIVPLAKMKDSVRKCTKITCYLFINLKYELDSGSCVV